jgi:acyl-CoA thioesterase
MSDLAKAQEFFGNDRFATEAAGIVITDVGRNYAKVELDLEARHYNAIGAVMGGVYFTMADFAFAIASNHNADPCVTLSSQITYLNGTRGKHLICEAHCLKDGRKTCFYELTVEDELGTEIARITTQGYKLVK